MGQFGCISRITYVVHTLNTHTRFGSYFLSLTSSKLHNEKHVYSIQCTYNTRKYSECVHCSKIFRIRYVRDVEGAVATCITSHVCREIVRERGRGGPGNQCKE